MLIVLSPAKSLDFDSPLKTKLKAKTKTHPIFLNDAAELIGVTKQLNAQELEKLMAISPALAELNLQRFQDWSETPLKQHSREAIFAFNGDVYGGLDAQSLTASELGYLQDRLRILSGLYGVLMPFDQIQAYRLEMGRGLVTERGKNLYEFWGNKVTEALQNSLSKEKHPILVNLASEEYFKVVKPRLLNATVITPVFQDWKNGHYKIISFFAKRARGLMTNYCARNKIKKVKELKDFTMDGYRFDAETSTETHWNFRRKQA